ncbi:MAG: M14 family metallopeptidase [Cellulophaga sp.]|nr:M14 family metallopeptidase [Cellulophaga sp.]
MINYKTIQAAIKVKTIQGRYVTNHHIFPFLDTLNDTFLIETIGQSVLGKDIKSVTFGSGKLKIFMWSQMHGNESTTTKAVLDFLNFMQTNSDFARQLMQQCTFKIIPILNPDGAEAYTRVNANKVDLNRDAQDRSQPESIVLRDTYEAFKPDYCFNLHDQRTIFNVGDTSKPATVSFLAPAHDEERSISPSRAISMQLIVAMNKELQQYIPNQIGRYDDGFNANCVGDTFQMLNKPTILFESGHFENDFLREETRIYIFCAMLKAIEVIATNAIQDYKQEDYFMIPENGKLFFDVIIKNASLINPKLPNDRSLGLLFQETLENEEIKFIPKISEIGNLNDFFGHKIYNCLNSIELDALKRNKQLTDVILNIE